MIEDLKQALKSLRRRRGTGAAVALTLAVVIGANAVVFTLVHGILLAPLPYPEPERIVAVWPEVWFSKGMFERFAAEATSFEAVAGYSGSALVLKDQGASTLVLGPEVTGGFFAVLGTTPVVGTLFETGEARPGIEPAIVLTHELWQRRFGGDPGVVGRTLRFEGGSRTVVGVLPPEVDLLQEGAEVVQRLVLDPDATDYDKAQYLRLIARLRPGVSAAAASAEARAIAGRWAVAREWSDATVQAAGVVQLREHLVGESRPLLLVLMAAVGLLLLVAVANVVHLLLAARTARGKELAVRTALGAGHGRLARMFVAEALLLALAGGSAGLLLARFLVPLVVRLAPFELPRLASVQVGPAAVAFTLLLSLVTALAAALMPAFGLARGRLEEGLREEGRGTTASRAGDRLRRVLVAAEVTLSLVVLIAAALLVRSFWHLTRVDPGFAPQGLYSATLLPPAERTADAAAAEAFYQGVLERAEAVPGVVAAGLVQTQPISGGGWVMEVVPEGRQDAAGAESPTAYWRVVTPGYLELLGARRLRGRGLAASDRHGAPDVAVVDRSFARLLWPGEDPIGRRFRMPFEERPEGITVVGVIEDTRHLGLRRDPVPTVYRPLAQSLETYVGVGATQLALVVRTAGDPAAGGSELLAALRAAEPELAVVDPATLEQRLARSLTEPRVTAVTLLLFAGAALLLAVIGLFGIVSRLVAELTPEIAVRRVLGADGGEVLRLVLGRSLLPVAIGLVVGAAAGLAASRLLTSLLFQVQPSDPASVMAAVAVLAVVALLAAWLPARRAARIEPMAALD
ncbi:MAG TPA: ABC transporter permease [Thermoanaerobaculia bacterium]|nr:ABC transporter permease [Thermoanaerobaculia bacterium]